MMCERPLIRSPHGKVFSKFRDGSISSDKLIDGTPIPCGQCMACRINKRRMWTARLMLESLCHTSSAFVTLTYNNEHCTGQLEKRDCQLFLKRLRFHVSKFFPDARIRFYLCGEYGPKTYRPHYHAILFGLPESLATLHFIEKCWSDHDGKKIGNVYLGYDCSMHAMRYVAGYCTKKYLKKDSLIFGPTKEPEFSLMSRMPGIGVPALQLIASELVSKNVTQHHIIQLGQRTFPLGRTLAKKLGRLIGLTAFDFCAEQETFASELYTKWELANDLYATISDLTCEPLVQLLIDESDAHRKRMYRLAKLFDNRDAI